MGPRQDTTFLGVLFLILFVLLVSAKSFAQQTVLEDDFEDEDLTQNPKWTGDLTDFTFDEDNGNNLLRLNLSEEGSTQLATESRTTYGAWEFFIDLNFSPSGSNFSEIFLISDRDDFDGDVNGYAIRYGEGGSDDRFRLLRYTNGNSTEILAGNLDLSSGGPFQVRVTRDDSADWNLFESSGFGSSPSLAGTVNDNTHTISSHFGFYLEYTSSRADQFFFDNIAIENSEPFDVVFAEVASATEIDITFNYQIDNTSLDPADFFLDGGLGAPTSVSLEDDFTVRLSYGSVLPEGNYTLTVNNVDNIYDGTIQTDTESDFSVSNPFDVVSVNVVTASRISVEFTVPPDVTSWSLTDFEITEYGSSNGGINPTSVDYDDTSEPNTIYLNLGSSLVIGDYNFSIQNVTSTEDWPIAGAAEFNFTVSNPFFVTEFEYLSRTEFDITFSQDVDD